MSSWMDAHSGNLDESGSTDNAEERSHDARDAESVNIFGTNETNFLFNSSTSDYFGSIDDESSLQHFGSLQPEQRTQQRESSHQYAQSTQRNWQGSTYQVEGPGQNSPERFPTVASGKDWPSLQIVCPTSPLYRPLADSSGPPSAQQVSRSFSEDASYAGSGYRDTRGGGRSESAYSGMRSMPYYPAPSVGMMEESPLSYHKMGSGSTSHAPSPFGSPSGYRSHIYGTPLTPRGGANALLSPARSPAVHRRFMEPIDGYIYQVQFKRAHKNFILAPSAPRNIIPGDFVKVEADRGEDMGIVLSKSPANEFEEVIPTAGYRGRGFSSGQGERKFLFRLANADERAALVHKVHDEERALEVIRTKVLEQLLPMTILDAEYQFDRHKLTFFFEADRRIDFRELVSELFSLYKTRIWMQQVDTSVLGMSDAGSELAKATGFLPERDDHAYLQTTTHMRRLDGSAAAAASAAGPSAFGLEPADSARLLEHDAPAPDTHRYPPHQPLSGQGSQSQTVSFQQPQQALQTLQTQPAQVPALSQHQGYSFLSSQPAASSGLHNLQALSLALPAAPASSVGDPRDRGMHQPGVGLRGSYSTPSMQTPYRPATSNNTNLSFNTNTNSATYASGGLEYGPGGLLENRASSSAYLTTTAAAANAVERPVSRLPRASVQSFMLPSENSASVRQPATLMQMPVVPMPAVPVGGGSYTINASPWSLSGPVTNAFSPQHRQPSQLQQQGQQQTWSQPPQAAQQPSQQQPQRHHQFSPYAAPFHPMQEKAQSQQSQQQSFAYQQQDQQQRGIYEHRAGQDGSPWREQPGGSEGGEDRSGYDYYDGYAGGGGSSSSTTASNGYTNGHTNGTPRPAAFAPAVSGEKDPFEWCAVPLEAEYTDDQGTAAFKQEIHPQEQDFQQRYLPQEHHQYDLKNQQDEEQGQEQDQEQQEQWEKNVGSGSGAFDAFDAHN